MNKPYISAILAVTTLAFSEGATAFDKSNSEYKSAEKKISADYKSAEKECNELAGNAKNICLAEAKRMEKSAKSKLKARHKPKNNLNNKMTTSKAALETPMTDTTATMDHLRRP